MRILQLDSLLNGGGTDDQCLGLTQGLAALGEDVWLAGPADRELSQRAKGLGVRMLDLPAGGALKIGMVRALARHCRDRRIEVLHAHHGRDYWPAIVAARLSGVRPKVVLTRHLAKSPGSLASRHGLLHACDAVIAVSHFVARVLREGVYEPASPVEERRARPPMRGDHRKIHVIHGGLDPARFRPADGMAQREAWGLPPGTVAFGVAGGYDLPRGKGQRDFLEAAARTSRSSPQARFLIIGRGTLEAALKADIARLGLAGRAWLTPYSKDMPQSMNALDCLVHPQVGTEAFGMVVVEAMACDKPVVATRCDGVPEVFVHDVHGLVVPMEDTQALAEAMTRIAGDDALRRRLGSSGRRHVLGHFTLDLMAARVLELYRSLRPSGPAEP